MRIGLVVLGLLVGCSGDTGKDTSTSTSTTTGTSTGQTTSTTTGTNTGTSTSTTTTNPNAASVVVGNGETAHSALSDGDHVTMFHGAQGGWHIEVSGFVSNTGSAVAVSPTVTHTASGTVLAGVQPESFILLAGWTIASQNGVFVGTKALLDDVADWAQMNRFCEYENEALELCVHIEDLADASIQADDCVTVIADLHVDDVDNCATAR